MSVASLDLDGRSISIDLAKPCSLAIPLGFNRPQPRFFGAPSAVREPLQSGDWIGDTRRGGNCNAEILTLVPHCNGTHTECVGHIVDQDIAVADAAPEGLVGAALASIEPMPAGECEDALPAALPAGQVVISRRQVEDCFGNMPAAFMRAVIIRTLPNHESKRYRDYDDGEPIAFLTTDAVAFLVERGCEHLLLDIPSLDFARDPELRGHHFFFGLPQGVNDVNDAARAQCTITEMIFVPDECSDGRFLLNLQLPAFLTDAAPSRPLIYRVMES